VPPVSLTTPFGVPVVPEVSKFISKKIKIQNRESRVTKTYREYKEDELTQLEHMEQSQFLHSLDHHSQNTNLQADFFLHVNPFFERLSS
jgi:hypothetical protein